MFVSSVVGTPIFYCCKANLVLGKQGVACRKISKPLYLTSSLSFLYEVICMLEVFESYVYSAFLTSASRVLFRPVYVSPIFFTFDTFHAKS